MEPKEDAKEQFDEERRSAITSTDVAAILGLSKWSTPLSVFKEKVGEGNPWKPSLPAWLGNRMEEIVSELYTQASGNRVRADNRFHRHPQYPWFGCHLDRRVVGDPDLIVELKTRNSLQGWGEDGSSDVPPDIFCQVQSQLLITDAREAHVAVLFNSRAFRVYRLTPDLDFAAKLYPTLEDFWFNYVLAGVPPLPSGRDVDTDIINAIAGGTTGVMKSATPEMEELVQRLRLVRLEAAQVELAKTEAENRIKALIGDDADGLTGAFGTVSWKRTAEIHRVDWKAIADDLLPTLPGELADSLRSQHTVVSPGVRRFEPKFRDE